MKLTDTQHAILAAAAQHPALLALPPARLPAGARQKVAQALLRSDLLMAFHGADADRTPDALWKVDGESYLLRLTDDGLRAIGIEPETAVAVAERGGLTAAEYHEEQSLAQEALDAGLALRADEDDQSAAAIARRNAERCAAAEAAAQEEAPNADADDERPRHERLGVDEALIYGPAEEWQQPTDDEALLEQALAERTPRRVVAAAQALLAAWDACPAQDATDNAISRAVEALRVALAGKPPRTPGAPRQPRQGTKQGAVLALLRREEGATVAQIADATGWAAHTVRGVFAGLKKKGHEVQVLERVRMVGPNKEGAKGSYTIYHLPA
jgi:hypothetical protein